MQPVYATGVMNNIDGNQLFCYSTYKMTIEKLLKLNNCYFVNEWIE